MHSGFCSHVALFRDFEETKQEDRTLHFPILFMDEGSGESTWRLLLPLLSLFLVRRRPCPIRGKKGDSHMYFLNLQGEKRMGENGRERDAENSILGGNRKIQRKGMVRSRER